MGGSEGHELLRDQIKGVLMGWTSEDAERESEEFFARSNTGRNWKPKKKGKYFFFPLPIPGHPGKPFLPQGKHELKGKEYRAAICNRMTHSYIDPQTRIKRPVPCVACVYRAALEREGQGLALELAGSLEPKMNNLIWAYIRGEEGVHTWAMSPSQFKKLGKLAVNGFTLGDVETSYGVAFDYDPDKEDKRTVYDNFQLVTRRVKKDANGNKIVGADGKVLIEKVPPGLAGFAGADEEWVQELIASSPSPGKVIPIKSPSDLADTFKIPPKYKAAVRDAYDRALAILSEGPGTEEEAAIIDDDGGIIEGAEEPLDPDEGQTSEEEALASDGGEDLVPEDEPYTEEAENGEELQTGEEEALQDELLPEDEPTYELEEESNPVAEEATALPSKAQLDAMLKEEQKRAQAQAAKAAAAAKPKLTAVASKPAVRSAGVRPPLRSVAKK